jgi:flagellar protein FlbD
MIKLKTLKGNIFYLNAELIEKIEELPDTLITLIGGKKLWVSESADKVVEKVISYKKAIHCSDWEVNS